MIKYKCPHCKTPLETEEALSGRQDTCPECGKVHTVPLSKEDLAKQKAAENERRRAAAQAEQERKRAAASAGGAVRMRHRSPTPLDLTDSEDQEDQQRRQRNADKQPVPHVENHVTRSRLGTAPRRRPF